MQAKANAIFAYIEVQSRKKSDASYSSLSFLHSIEEDILFYWSYLLEWSQLSLQFEIPPSLPELVRWKDFPPQAQWNFLELPSSRLRE